MIYISKMDQNSGENHSKLLVYQTVPSGKRLHNYGKSPFSMGKST